MTPPSVFAGGTDDIAPGSEITRTEQGEEHDSLPRWPSLAFAGRSVTGCCIGRCPATTAISSVCPLGHQRCLSAVEPPEMLQAVRELLLPANLSVSAG